MGRAECDSEMFSSVELKIPTSVKQVFSREDDIHDILSLPLQIPRVTRGTPTNPSGFSRRVVCKLQFLFQAAKPLWAVVLPNSTPPKGKGTLRTLAIQSSLAHMNGWESSISGLIHEL
jgi:hypothetical protein